MFQNKTIFPVLGVLVCSRQRPVTPVGWRLGSARGGCWLLVGSFTACCCHCLATGHYQLQHSTHTECCLRHLHPSNTLQPRPSSNLELDGRIQGVIEWRPRPLLSHGVTNNNTAVPRFYYYVNTEYTYSEYV